MVLFVIECWTLSQGKASRMTSPIVLGVGGEKKRFVDTGSDGNHRVHISLRDVVVGKLLTPP